MDFDPYNQFLKIWESNAITTITTLALGLWPRQGIARLQAKRGSPVVKEIVREWTFTLPRELPPWELESWWTPECLESNNKGKKSMDWVVLYIIGKILKRKYLKWAWMTHLDI
jgi:hypothetical protein